MEDREMGDFSHDDSEITDEEVARLQQASSPRAMGVMLTVFVAVLVVMIGGLASYYYYTTQKQGSSHEQVIRDNWDEVVLTTTDLANAFDRISDFSALFDDTKDSFQKVLSESNGVLKDVSYNLRSISGYAFSGSVVISRMEGLVEAYLDFLRELQSVIEKMKGGLLEDIKEVETLGTLSTDLNEAYDKLLIADKNQSLASSLPADLFKMSDGIKGLAEKYLEDKQKQSEADEASKTAANEVVSKFLQAYVNKDADSMMSYLTEEAKAEFNRGIVEEAVEIKSFKILDTRKISDTKVELDAELTKETPSQETYREKKRFTLLKKDDKWWIDIWKSFS